MKVNILNTQGQSTGREVELPESVFGIEPNEHAVYLSVKQYLANQRQGTHKAKERAEIAGSTRKIKRQKGTGTARAGSIKSPIFRGGGRVFGPRPRNYGIKLNKKVRQLARKSVLSDKFKNESVVVLEDFSFDTPKTKAYLDILKGLNAENTKTLLVLGDRDKNLYLSARNIPKAAVRPASDLNTYEILHADKLILSESSLEALEKSFS